jgi:hypothetical protein
MEVLSEGTRGAFGQSTLTWWRNHTATERVVRPSEKLHRSLPTPSRTQHTTQPTTERVLAAFANLTLTTIQTTGEYYRHVTPLNPTQRQILVLLGLPDDLYERLASPSVNFVLHLRE